MFLNDSIYDIKDYTDIYGNKIKKKRVNIPFVVKDNKIETGEVLDRIDHVYANGLYEVGIQNQISETDKFKVNYDTGTIFVHSSKEGQTLNLTFSAKSQIRYKAKNVVIEDLDGNYVGENVEDALSESADRINNLVNGNTQAGETQDAHLDSVYNVTDITLKQGLDRRTQIIKQNSDNIGDITRLNTTDKTNLVGAINEHETQLNNIPNQSYITEKAKTVDVNNALALKANQSALDATNNNVSANTTNINANTLAINNIGNGSPKGTYATLTALQTAYPTGTTGVYVVTADGKWYYWNGSAWTAGGIYQSTGIAKASVASEIIKPSSIRPYNTDFLQYSINKLNISALTLSNYISNTNGNIVFDASWKSSDYMPVDYGKTYLFQKSTSGSYTEITNVYGAFYDISYSFISGFVGKVSDQVVPANAKYIRVSNYSATFDSSPMFGSTIDFPSGMSKYIPYTIFMNDLDVSTKVLQMSGVHFMFGGSNIPLFDFSTSIFTFPVNSQENAIMIKGVYTRLQKGIGAGGTDLVFDISASVVSTGWGCVVIDTSTNTVKVRGYNSVLSTDLIVATFTPQGVVEAIFPFNTKMNAGDIPLFMGQSYSKTYIDSALQRDYDKTVKGINRIGYNKLVYPENSLFAFKAAKQAGFNYLLCDVCFTSDGVPVLLHDQSINRVARNNDGSSISGTINIDTITYSQALNYDFGISMGSQYSMRILTFEDFLKWCKKVGVKIYVEFKFGLTQSNIQNIILMSKKYGMFKNISWCCDTKRKAPYLDVEGWIFATDNTARIGIMPPTSVTTTHITDAVAVKSSLNEVFLFGWDTTVLTDDLVTQMITNNIQWEVGTLNTNTNIINYVASYPFVTGISSDSYIAGKSLYDNNIN